MDKQRKKRLDSTHDLSSSQRAYLKENHNISPEKFDKMSTVHQREWSEEAKEGAYHKASEQVKDYERRKSGKKKTFYIGKK